VRIGELADRLGINPRTIRFYERIGLLPEPERTPSGYRTYGEPDAERLTFIKTAQRLGLTLDEIREIVELRDRGQRPCGYVAGLLRRQVADLDRRIAEMVDLREELRGLEAAASSLSGDGEGYCELIEHVRVR
jgi:DNA-binding transcriptional MerR regulator